MAVGFFQELVTGDLLCTCWQVGPPVEETCSGVEVTLEQISAVYIEMPVDSGSTSWHSVQWDGHWRDLVFIHHSYQLSFFVVTTYKRLGKGGGWEGNQSLTSKNSLFVRGDRLVSGDFR